MERAGAGRVATGGASVAGHPKGVSYRFYIGRIIATEVKPMETAYIVTGTLTDEHTVKLDEPLPLAQGKVRLKVEPLAPAPKHPHDEVIAEIWARQNARGHQPRTREEIDAYIQAERDSWDD